MRDFTVWVSYGKWRKNGDIRYCLLHLIHLSSTRLRRCGRILSGICEPYCLITPDLTMRYCPILILIDYINPKATKPSWKKTSKPAKPSANCPRKNNASNAKRLMKHLMISTTANSVAKTDKGRLKKPDCTQKVGYSIQTYRCSFYDQSYASNNKPHPIIYTVA